MEENSSKVESRIDKFFEFMEKAEEVVKSAVIWTAFIIIVRFVLSGGVDIGIMFK